MAKDGMAKDGSQFSLPPFLTCFRWLFSGLFHVVVAFPQCSSSIRFCPRRCGNTLLALFVKLLLLVRFTSAASSSSFLRSVLALFLRHGTLTSVAKTFLQLQYLPFANFILFFSLPSFSLRQNLNSLPNRSPLPIQFLLTKLITSLPPFLAPSARSPPSLNVFPWEIHNMAMLILLYIQLLYVHVSRRSSKSKIRLARCCYNPSTLANR